MSSFYGMRNNPSCKPGHIAAVMALALMPALAAVAAEPGPSPLPKKQIEAVYRNGDIDSVIFYLKQGREKPMFLDKSDSVLAFKYLGIIYSADKDKREKGRYYFNQMLRLDPGASITELLPGENARTVFKEAREEFFELNPALVPRPDGPPVTIRTSPPPPAEAQAQSALPASEPLAAPAAEVKPRKSISPVWWWVAGGAVVVGAAAVTVAVLEPEPETHKLSDSP